ncbi:MAG: hypothetical protein GX224_05500 [Thermoplasmatales archaeon]|nr:hypothetical protein [Thermoplasmatales archaeon]
MDKGEYTDQLLNVILDEIDDIILLHDCEHRIVWMNRSGLDAFKVRLDGVMGKSCYTLFGRSTCCQDCESTLTVGSKRRMTKTIPGTDDTYMCKSTPLISDGEVKLVVQHLSRVKE